MDLNDIKREYSNCTKCSGCLTSVKVFGYGNPKTEILVVGEGPGREECIKGIPFVGAAGKLLDKILGAIDLKREDLYFTNTVLCRTNEKNRIPTKNEVTNCKERLLKELTLIDPKFILIVGSIALKTLFGARFKITKAHGKWLLLSEPCRPCFPILHPAYILHSRTEEEKKAKKFIMWEDVKKLSADMKSLSKLLKDG